MSGIQVALKLQSPHALAWMLERLAAAAGDLKPAFRDIGEAMLRSTHQRFDAQVSPAGAAWAPLAAATAKRKKGPGILTEDGTLRGTVVYQVSANAVRIGSNMVYAAIHQLGGTVKHTAKARVAVIDKRGRFKKKRSAARGKKQTHIRFLRGGTWNIPIPARPYLGFSRGDQAKIAKILERHLRRATEG